MVAVAGTISDVKIKMVVANTLTDSTANFSLGTSPANSKIGVFPIQNGFDVYGNLPNNLSFGPPGVDDRGGLRRRHRAGAAQRYAGQPHQKERRSGARLTSLCLFGCKARVTSSVKPASFDITRSVAV